MRKSKNKVHGWFVLAACLGLLVISCATKPEAYKNIDNAVFRNEFELGIEAIKKGQEQKRPIYRDNNAISLYLDKGLLEHYAGRYADSSQSLQEAERLIEDAFTKSVTANIASYIANDNTKEYPGEDFEDIYINIFNALNYYNNGNIEGALVEIRKLTWTNGKLDMLGRKYDGVKASAGEYMLEQLKKIGISLNPQLPQGDPVNFSSSALAHYLGALFYLGEGNTDSARIEFNLVEEAFTANPNVYYHPFPVSVAAVRNVPDGKVRLNVIAFTGFGPTKEEGKFDSFFPFFSSSILWSTQFKLPKLVKRPSRIDRIEILINGETFNLELIEDMGAVVTETYNARFGSLFFKTYIRTMLKYAAVDVAAMVATDQLGDLAGMASAAAGKATADASESADIRMSRYFPDKAYIGGINLEPGNYDAVIHFYAGNTIIAKEERNVTVRQNGLNLLEAINLK